MIYYLMLAVAAIGTAGNFALTKVYQKTMGDAVRESIIFNMMIGLFSIVFFWIAGGFQWEFTPYSAIMTFLMSLFVGIYTMIGFKLMSMGSMTVYTIFLMLGGAIVPYVYGLIFLDEPITSARIVALLLIVAAVVINGSRGKTEKQSVKFIILCIAVFLLNGATSVVSKMHQVETEYRLVSAESFVVLKSVTRFLFFAILLPFCRKKTKEHKPMPPKMYFVMICSAVVSGFAYMWQLIGAAYLPATVLYPIVTGGTIVATSLFDKICFAQRLHKNTIISIVLCVIALVLFVI